MNFIENTENRKFTKDSIIGLASDHSGYQAKELMKQILDEQKIIYIDYGCHSLDSCDYFEFVSSLCQDIKNNYIFYGFCFCRTGQGVNICANKHEHIISALVYNDFAAQMAVEHNGANVFCFPALETKKSILEKQIHIILISNFEGGRFSRRLRKMYQFIKL